MPKALVNADNKILVSAGKVATDECDPGCCGQDCNLGGGCCKKSVYPTHISGSFSWEYHGYRPAFAATLDFSGSGTFDQDLNPPSGSNPPTPTGDETIVTTSGSTTETCTPDEGDPFTSDSSPNIEFQVFCQGAGNPNQNDPDPDHQGWLMKLFIGSPDFCIGQVSFTSAGDYFGTPYGYGNFFNYATLAEGPLGTFSFDLVLLGGAAFGTGTCTVNLTLTGSSCCIENAPTSPSTYDISYSIGFTLNAGSGCGSSVTGSANGSASGDFDDDNWGGSADYCQQFIPLAAIRTQSTVHCPSDCDNLPDTDVTITIDTTVEVRIYFVGCEWRIVLSFAGNRPSCGFGSEEPGIPETEFVIGSDIIGTHVLSATNACCGIDATIVIA